VRRAERAGGGRREGNSWLGASGPEGDYRRRASGDGGNSNCWFGADGHCRSVERHGRFWARRAR
jgi:hypothetical protein